MAKHIYFYMIFRTSVQVLNVEFNFKKGREFICQGNLSINCLVKLI